MKLTPGGPERGPIMCLQSPWQGLETLRRRPFSSLLSGPSICLPSFLRDEKRENAVAPFSIDPSLLFTAPAGGGRRRQTTGRDEKETGCRDRRHFRPCLLRPLFSLFLHLSQARRSSTVPGLPPPLSIPRKSLLMIVFLPPSSLFSLPLSHSHLLCTVVGSSSVRYSYHLARWSSFRGSGRSRRLSGLFFALASQL